MDSPSGNFPTPVTKYPSSSGDAIDAWDLNPKDSRSVSLTLPTIIPINNLDSDNSNKDLKDSKITLSSNDGEKSVDNFIVNQVATGRIAASEHIENLLNTVKTKANENLENEFQQEFNKLQQEYNSIKETVKNFKDVKDNVDNFLKILRNNQQNFLPFLRLIISQDEYELVELAIQNGDEHVKFIQPLFPVIQCAWEVNELHRLTNKLKLLSKRHKDILKNKDEGKRLVDDFDKELGDRLKESMKKGGFKLTQLITYRLIPIAIVSLVNNWDNKVIVKVLKLFFRLLKKGLKIYEFGDNHALQRKWKEDLQPQFKVKIGFTEDFQAFITKKKEKTSEELQITEELIEEYQTEAKQKAYEEQPDMLDLLEQKRQEQEIKFAESCALFDQLNQDYADIDFNNFIVALKQHAFISDDLFNFPRTRDEWDKKIAEPLFKQKFCINDERSALFDQLNQEYADSEYEEFLAELNNHAFISNDTLNFPRTKAQWNQKMLEPGFKEDLCIHLIERQMTIAKLIQQGMQCALSAKIDVENRFLIFNFIKNLAEVITTIVQIIMLIPKGALYLAKLGLEKIDEQLPIPGIELCFMLNPDVDLTYLGISWMLVTHAFGYYNKPNEYSLNGYSIDLQTKWTHVRYNFTYFLMTLLKWSFQITDKLIEICLHNKKNPHTEVPKYEKLTEKLRLNRECYNKQLKELEKQLDLLKLKDIKLVLNPKQTAKEVDGRERDSLQIMIDELKSAELSMFPQDVIDFFQERANISLLDSEDDIEDDMRDIFIASEKSFFKNYKKAFDHAPEPELVYN